MKSNSDDKPNVFQNLGNGSWFYNYNFKEIDQPKEVGQEDVPAKKAWECDSVLLWGIPNKQDTKKAVIANIWDVTQEIDLANDNKRFELGISKDKSLQDKYIAYLNKVEEIKQMVDSDFENFSDQLIQ